jgi:DNA-binding CsgD family transcriptional regulator
MLDRTMNDLIGSIYDAALDAELWVDALNMVRRITPCRVASLYSLDRLADTPTIHQLVGMDVAAERDFLQKWGSDNPITGAVAHLEPGQVRGLASVLDYEALKLTPIFREWAEPNGYCDGINIMFESTVSRLAAVSLIRGVEHGPADAPALARLELLAPRFLRAVRIGRVLENATLRETTFERTLDALASAVLLVNPTGGLVYANVAAQKLIRAGLPLSRMAGAAAADQAQLITLEDGVRRVSHCLPLGHLGAGQTSNRLRGCRVVVLKEEARVESAIASAATVYKLTRRECDVLFGLYESGGVPAISRLLGISKNTVSTHMKRLFQKTGTQRQAELASLVSAMASPFLPAVAPSSAQ